MVGNLSLLVCSCDLPHSLLLQHASSDVERLLIGNKCDWEAKRAVESERGEQLARSQGIPFLETSAKTGHNIDEVRGHLVGVIVNNTMLSKDKHCP